MHRFFYLLVSFFILLSSPSWARSDTLPTPTTHYSADMLAPVSIGANMLHIKDPERLENIVSILQSDARKDELAQNNTTKKSRDNYLSWHKIDRSSPNFGFTDTAHWFKFNINNTSQNELSIYIELPIPFLDDVELYQTHEHFDQQLLRFNARLLEPQHQLLKLTTDRQCLPKRRFYHCHFFVWPQNPHIQTRLAVLVL